VWVIDAEQWPRACLRAELMERGFEVIGFDQMTRAMAALRNGLYQRPFLVILELRCLAAQPSQIKALVRLNMPKILLGGAVELNEPWINKGEWDEIIQRPFTIGKVVDAVENLKKRLLNYPEQFKKYCR
jgi:DNA-binding NtrC family response regulator